MPQGGTRESIRRRLQAIVQSLNEDDEHDSLDVYRTLQQQANLLFHTQRVKDHLASDPFERFREPHLRTQLGRLSQNVQVTQFDHVATAAGYVLIEAAVDIQPLPPSNKSSSRSSHRPTGRNPKQPKQQQQSIALRCRYEREAIVGTTNSSNPCSVRYSIDLCRDSCGPTQPLLWVQVFAPGGTPSSNGAKCLDDDEDEDGRSENNDDAGDGWSDMEDNDDAAQEEAEAGGESGGPEERGSKRSKTSAEPKALVDLPDATKEASTTTSSSASSTEPHDHFTASIDPEVLQSFLDKVQLGDVNEATAFFLLMSFPFYEHEWDLVGFILDEVFGMESDEEDEDDDEEEEDGSDKDESVTERASSKPTRPRKHGRSSG